MPTVDVRLGDCLDVLKTLPDGSVDAVVTSPPYAEQRAKQYGGIPEGEYPDWCVRWMAGVRRTLKPAGSVLINIREHVKGGQISDYVHRTRLALRADGWLEPDELIWIKPDGMPVGHVGRPRRSWERILWFALSPDCECYPKANGRHSDRIGLRASPSRNANAWIHGESAQSMKDGGVARCQDWVSISVRCNPDGEWNHPAAYPPQLAEWMMRLVTKEGGIVLDPFLGSGTTAVASLNAGRNCIGIERDPAYHAIATARIAAALAATPLFA